MRGYLGDRRVDLDGELQKELHDSSSSQVVICCCAMGPLFLLSSDIGPDQMGGFNSLSGVWTKLRAELRGLLRNVRLQDKSVIKSPQRLIV